MAATRNKTQSTPTRPARSAASGSPPIRPGAVATDDRSLDRYIGNVVRELRLHDKLTINEVAAMAGISRGMVSKIENGQVSSSLETLSRLAQARGHTYHLLAYDQGPNKSFEPFFITMDDASEVFPTFEHPGTEFIYLLKGRLEYRHGQHRYNLEPGDSLTFRGDIPHGPEHLIETPIHLLSIIMYGGNP
jgi:transcriptional regulator with XRE-family HTH domain